MIRRLLSSSLVAVLALGPATAALADGPVGGTHTYRPARVVPRAAPVTMAPPAEQVLRVDLTTDGAQSLTLARGKSAIIELPVDVRDMLVTNPQVADAVLRSPRRIYVLGQALGSTDAVFFDAAGRKILSLAIRVDQDSGQLEQTLRRVLPNANIHVEPIRDSVILTGLVANASESNMASQIAAQFVNKPENVLNMLAIAGKDQVMLKVRIVEVQRNVIKQLGVNLQALMGQIGGPQYGFGFTPTYGVNGGLIGGGSGGYATDTTSQPVSSLSSLLGLIPGAGSASTVLQFLTRFISGDSTLSGPQNAFLQNYINNTASQTTAVIGNVTWTMADVGVSSSDLPNILTNYLSGTGGTPSGNDPRSIWIRNFTSNINAPITTGQEYIDRNNKLATVKSGLAGSSGLNKANATVQAFERVGLVRTLAEPNLTVVSGEAGKFLVGGEFPVPVGQDSTGRVTIEFKPYGVGLGYTPMVMSGGRISLKLSTEVSELTSLGAFTLTSTGGSSQLTVPGLSVRRAETTVELPSGGSLMIAGLLQQQSKQNIDALPGMTSLPVLGQLFRSRDYLNGETELVIIITPYIVDPTRPQDLQTPADGLETAGDMSTVLLGRLNKVVKAPPGANTGRAYQGPVGYVIE